MANNDKDINPFATDSDINPFASVDAYNPFEQRRYDDEPQVPLDNQPTPAQNAELKFRDPSYDDPFYGDQSSDALLPNSPPPNPIAPALPTSPPSSRFDDDLSARSTTIRTSSGTRVTVQEGSAPDAEGDRLSFWELAYYQQFFNVDSKDVAIRCLRSMWPFKYDFIASIKENPDFYGPFWISTTLIFMMAASANFAAYLDNTESWHYDFLKLTYGSAVIYGYSFAIPLVFWMYIRWVDIRVRLIEVLCIYGYSLFIYSPAAILCVIPIYWAQWVVVMVGCAISTSFLVVNLWMPLRAKMAHALAILGIMALLHVGLALTFRLYFFQYNT